MSDTQIATRRPTRWYVVDRDGRDVGMPTFTDRADALAYLDRFLPAGWQRHLHLEQRGWWRDAPPSVFPL